MDLGRKIEDFKIAKGGSEWADWVGKFTDLYNMYTPKKYQKSCAIIGDRLALIVKQNGIGSLHQFYKDCENARHPGKFLQHFLFPKK